jgi:hypothetical protein
MRSISNPPLGSHFGNAWVLLCIILGLHTWDEAAHELISFYNATILTLYGEHPSFPRIDLGFHTWLVLAIAANLFLLVLAPLAYRNRRSIRPFAYFITIAATLDALGLILLSIRGRTVSSVHFRGVAPGAYTAPLLLAAAIYLFWSLQKSLPTHTPDAKI